ncbi:hypothetical protein [Bradyrhizobium cosmicum]|uniref:hypothetical protein n=1 Tax=Bradyrhizobium cosmicum TaxID=1404864 RepID=UPI00143D4881|nr:hypothetical protein [Bradyrhizobium cosmicum]
MIEADSVHSTPPLNASVTPLSGLADERRRFLFHAAGVAAGGAAIAMGLPLPQPAGAAVASPDPIFAAIERHRAAYTAHDATLGDDQLEAEIPFRLRQSSFYDAESDVPDWRVKTDHPKWIAHIEEQRRTWHEEQKAAAELISTEGLTPAGAVALLAYARDREDRGDHWPDFEEGSWLYLMLCRVVEALAVTA